MWFWELVVLLRKVTLIGIGVFVSAPLLQMMAGLMVLMTSLVLQVSVKPYKRCAPTAYHPTHPSYGRLIHIQSQSHLSVHPYPYSYPHSSSRPHIP